MNRIWKTDLPISPTVCLLNITQLYFILNYPSIIEEWINPPKLWSINSCLLNTFSILWIEMSLTLLEFIKPQTKWYKLSCSNFPISTGIFPPFLPIPFWESPSAPWDDREDQAQVELTLLPTFPGSKRPGTRRSGVFWLQVPRSFRMPQRALSLVPSAITIVPPKEECHLKGLAQC